MGADDQPEECARDKWNVGCPSDVPLLSSSQIGWFCRAFALRMAPAMTLDYRNPTRQDEASQRRTWNSVVGWTLAGLGMLVLLALCLLPSLGRARETANRVKCASCLRQIGQAAMIYANDHAGQLPPDFVALYRHLDGDITPEVFTCPSSAIEKATGATTEQIVASMVADDHLSYAWAGGRMTTASPASVIIAFDLERHVPKDGARGTGINVLFNDGSVSFVDEPTAKAIRAQFIAGVRPIHLPTPTTKAAAATLPASS